MQEVYQDDYGIAFDAYARSSSGAIDLSTAQNLNLTFELPDGSELIKPASYVTDGTDGGLRYVAVTGFLSLPGLWRYRASYTRGAPIGLHTDWIEFLVLKSGGGL